MTMTQFTWTLTATWFLLVAGSLPPTMEAGVARVSRLQEKDPQEKESESESEGSGQDQQEQEADKENEEGAEEKPEALVELVLAEGRIDLQVPKAWEKKKPKFNIVEAEFAPKAVKAETLEKYPDPARLTVMASGGSIEQNIDRWIGQFSQEDDSDTAEDHTKKKKETINGMTVHLVDITGTFTDGMGGNGPKKENYRMLAAIVETKVAGNYFFKLYGDQATIDENEKRFLQMLKSMKITL